MMITLCRIVPSILFLLWGASAQNAAEQALRDMHIGMQGLQQAASDPAMMAQLMADLQNPELMAEAQKMMSNPEFQKQMKKFQQSKEFKEGFKKAAEKLSDPNQAAAAEAKLEHMVKVGNTELKKGARSAMEEAMAAMSNPEVMAEMAKMIKDPSFVRQLESMTKDPTFKNYIDAMQDMMKDPRTKAQFQQATEALKQRI